MQFEGLPEEILFLIGSGLPQGKPLTTFALLNRRFARICKPLFLANIFLGLREVQGLKQATPASDHKYCRLLRQLHDQPVLARHVRKLQVDINADPGHFLPSGIRLRDLINLLPNLSILKVTDTSDPCMLPSALGHFAVEQPMYNSMSIQDESYYEQLQEVFWQLAQKAGLRTLVLRNVSLRFPSNSLQSPRVVQGKPSIVDLRLYGIGDRVDNATYLEPILYHVIALRCLHLELKWDPIRSRMLAPIRVSNILRAIRHLSGTLEELCICLANFATPQIDAEDIRILPSFRKLRLLAIPAESVISQPSHLQQQLPASLEVLQLQYTISDAPNTNIGSRITQETSLCQQHVDEMRGFLSSASEWLPSLKRVIWWIQGPPLCGNWTFGYGSCLDSLEDAFTDKPKFYWLSEPSALKTPLLKETAV